MDPVTLLIIAPAVTALLIKGGIFVYARSSPTHNLQTRLYLGFLFALSIQNYAEIAGLYKLNAHDLTPYFEGYAFYASSIAVIALLAHLAAAVAFEQPRRWTKWAIRLVYLYAATLELLLIFTPHIVTDFIQFEYAFGRSLTRTPGALYFLFELYSVGIFLAVLAVLMHGSVRLRSPQARSRNAVLLIAIVPMAIVVIVVLALLHIGIRWANATVIFPLAITYFLVVTAYAVHQHRLFDIQFYIPWSKVRKRKTAFYDRIRAMIAEIADLASVNQAVERLADTLRCPVVLVGGPKPVLAAAGANQMATLPVGHLRAIDHILVANEIADTMPQMHTAMKQHGIAAVVPFYPHSQNASSWLLLGDTFSEQVYTPLDFRMVEQLFDRMADLFLDKLLTMRTQLAEAHSQIQTLEFRLKGAEVNAAGLENKIEALGRENLRLVREQPADSLLALPRQTQPGIAITLLGRDKALLKRLRERFPQTEQFAGPDSSSFRRQRIPDVLVCEIEIDSAVMQRKLIGLLTEQAHDTAVLLFGADAAAFAFEHRKRLLGNLVEVLPAGLTPEATIRKVEALAGLRETLFAMHSSDYPLAGCSDVYREAMSEARRLAGFMEPICLKTADTDEAIAVGAFLHEAAKSDGAFRVLRTGKLAALEPNAASADELQSVLADSAGGTLMIDNLCAISNEVWDQLLVQTKEFTNVRLIAACPPTSPQSPTALFKPLRPLVLELPTLRERRQDVPLFVHYYTLQFNLQAGTNQYLSQADIDELMDSNYPTDLSSLKTAVFDRLRGKEKQTIEGPALKLAESSKATDKTLDEYIAEFETRLIAETLQSCGGNKSKAARLLGVRPNTLHYKIERYGLLTSKD